MTFIVEDLNANYFDILFHAGALLQNMSDDGQLTHVKLLYQKAEKRQFGEILELKLISLHNPELILEGSIAINKVLGLTNSRLLGAYCQLD
jgi:hypothetical protein